MNASDKMKKTNIINKKNRPPKNKGKKTTITFSEASRKDFLTGFRKRKNERRKKAKEQLEKEYKEEVRKAKQKARDDVVNAKSTGASHQILPEIEHLIKGILFKSTNRLPSIQVLLISLICTLIYIL